MKRLILFILISLLLNFNFTFAQKKDNSLIIGTYQITKVVDGDTFKFKNLDKSTRLLCIDTEEMYKSKDARERTEEIAFRWKEFYAEKKSEKNSTYPIKLDSPFGYETGQWAKILVEDVDSVRLEKDDNTRNIDIYGRYLVYIILYKKGKEINYNIECVKTGHSPYFNKYGNSKRFHKEFFEAQEFAKSKKLGIWNSATLCYPDYKERLIWWNKRAEQLDNFEKKYSDKENYFNFLNDREYDRLENFIGKEVFIFGSIGDVFNNKLPYLIRFPHTRTESLDLVIYEENAGLIEEFDLNEIREYYVYAKGELKVRNGKYNIILRDKQQLWME